MSDDGDVLLPVLGWGIAGGLLGSLSCCCWFGPLGAGYLAARKVGGPANARIGLGVGLVSGLMVSTLGTAIFLATSDPELMGELGADQLPLGGLAFSYAMLGFGFALAGAGIGALMGSRREPEAPSGSALRFLDEDAPPSASPAPTAMRFLDEAAAQAPHSQAESAPEPPAALESEAAPEPPAALESEAALEPEAAAAPEPEAPAQPEPPTAPPQNDEAPAGAGAVEVQDSDLTSSDDEQDAWD